MIHFTINRQRFRSDAARVTVEWLLRRAGVDLEDAELVRTSDGETWKDLGAVVHLRDGDVFEATGRGQPVAPTTIRYSVNGEPQETSVSPLTLEQILRQAGEEAAVDLNRLDDYYLDNIMTGKRWENLGDEVPIAEGARFIALFAGPTPVA